MSEIKNCVLLAISCGDCVCSSELVRRQINVSVVFSSTIRRGFGTDAVQQPGTMKRFG